VNAAASQIQPLHRARVASGSVLAPLCAVLLLSGAARLVYQVTWVRPLGLTFGVTIYAISTVLAAFMAGLAIGSTLGGRLADTTRRPHAPSCYSAAKAQAAAKSVSAALLCNRLEFGVRRAVRLGAPRGTPFSMGRAESVQQQFGGGGPRRLPQLRYRRRIATPTATHARRSGLKKAETNSA
jgi:MFS family permease